MILYHTTTADVIPSVLRDGLRCDMSQGIRPVVWLHSEEKTWWAFVHVTRRHHCPVEQVVRLTVSVPRSWLRRSATGLWYCVRDVPASRITIVTTYAVVSRSPLEAS